MNFRIGQKVLVLDTPGVRRWEPWSIGRVGEVASAICPHGGMEGRYGHVVTVDGERLFFSPDEIEPIDDDSEKGTWELVQAITKWHPQRLPVSEGEQS